MLVVRHRPCTRGQPGQVHTKNRETEWITDWALDPSGHPRGKFSREAWRKSAWRGIFGPDRGRPCDLRHRSISPELDPAAAECAPHLCGRQPKQEADGASASLVGVSVVNYLSAPLLGDEAIP